MSDTAPESYGKVCLAADLEEAVAALTVCEWRELYGWLLQNYSENGLTGKVLGVMLLEGAKRLYDAGGMR
jgi:hypothetical protein